MEFPGFKFQLLEFQRSGSGSSSEVGRPYGEYGDHSESHRSAQTLGISPSASTLSSDINLEGPHCWRWALKKTFMTRPKPSTLNPEPCIPTLPLKLSISSPFDLKLLG